MTSNNEATRRMIEAAHALKVDYFLAGSYSTNVYGIPRATKDADFVAVIDSAGLKELMRLLGPEFHLDEQPSFETVTGTFREIIRVPSVPFEIEIFRLSDDPHDRSRFARRRTVHDDLLGCDVVVPSVEDVIITKLRWAKIAGRGKDRDDVRDILAVQGEAALDWEYIRGWCAQHGTCELLGQICASIPPLD